jgi:para-nitrobenzyl esterase
MAVLEPHVRIAAGDIAGTAAAGVHVYRGIPYAAPPVGPLRWRPPQPAVPWSGVHDGSCFGNDPVQLGHPLPIRRTLAPGVGEDCLTLNVWAPAETPPHGAPVVVWFDGGAFVATSGARAWIDGNAYARRGVVFVSVNYRVGVFGFLCHPALSAESPHGVSGNYGLLDAIAALHWVRDNIAAFGGDPRRITTFGVSGGATLCSLLAISPLATGLVDGMILRSPSAFRPLCTLAEAEAAGRLAGDDLTTMRNTPAEELLPLNAQIDPAVRGLTIPRPLRPVIDGWVLERTDTDAYFNGAFAAVPTIVGNTAGEGRELVADVSTYAIPPGRDSLVRRVTTTAQLREYLGENFGASFDEAWTHYGTDDDAAVVHQLAAVWGDVMNNYGVRTFAREIAQREPKTYRYLFTHTGAYTTDPPVHGNDMTYVFGTGEFEARDRSVSETIVALFANFIATGDPNAAGLPHWQPYDRDRDNYLELGGSFAERTAWRAEPCAFVERFMRTLALTIAVIAACIGVAAAPAKADDAITVIGSSNPTAFYEVLDHVAEHAGFFKEEHLTVTKEYANVGGAFTCAQLVASGKADVCSLGIEPIIQGYERGLKLQVFLGRDPRYGQVVAVLDDSPIKTLGDFHGMTLGEMTAGSTSEIAANATLMGAGLRKSDYAFLPIGYGPAAIAALTTKKVDAAAFPYPELASYAVKAHLKFRYFWNPILEDIGESSFSATPATIAAKSDQLTRYARAIVKASILVRVNPTLAARYFVEGAGLKETPQSIADEANLLTLCEDQLLGDDPTSLKIGYTSLQRITLYSNVLQQIGMTQGPVPASAIVTNQLVDGANAFDHKAFIARVKALH